MPDGQSAPLRGNGDVWPVMGSTHRHYLCGPEPGQSLGARNSVPHNHLGAYLSTMNSGLVEMLL